jgi:hypothetical protein
VDLELKEKAGMAFPAYAVEAKDAETGVFLTPN